MISCPKKSLYLIRISYLVLRLFNLVVIGRGDKCIKKQTDFQDEIKRHKKESITWGYYVDEERDFIILSTSSLKIGFLARKPLILSTP